MRKSRSAHVARPMRATAKKDSRCNETEHSADGRELQYFENDRFEKLVSFLPS